MNRVGRSEENQGTAGLQTKLDETGHSRTLQCRYQLAEKAERSDDSAANWAVNWNWERGILTGCRTGPKILYEPAPSIGILYKVVCEKLSCSQEPTTSLTFHHRYDALSHARSLL